MLKKNYFIVFFGTMLEKVLDVIVKHIVLDQPAPRQASCCSFILPGLSSSEVEVMFPVGTCTQSMHLHHIHLYRQESLGQGIIWACPCSPMIVFLLLLCGCEEELLSHNLTLVFYFFHIYLVSLELLYELLVTDFYMD